MTTGPGPMLRGPEGAIVEAGTVHADGARGAPAGGRACKATAIGVTKVGMPALDVFVLAVLAGAFIGLGAAFATTVGGGGGDVPYGILRLLVGLASRDHLADRGVRRARLRPLRRERGPDVSGVTWGSFLFDNLLPVTIGNVIGGALMVGAVYWFVYFRGRDSSS